MAKRMGIVTIFGCENDGAVLQNYALQKFLAQTFPEYCVETVNWRSLRFAVGEVLKGFRPSWRFPLAHFRRSQKMRGFWKSKLHLSPESLLSDDYRKQLDFVRDKYDVLVVGSDVVWHVFTGTFAARFPNLFWLSPDLPCRKIAYAASADKTHFLRWPEERQRFAREHLEAFDLLGVREQHTFDVVHSLQLSNADRVQIVPDPTFTLDLDDLGVDDDEVRTILRRAGLDLNRPIGCLNLWKRPDLARPICDYFRSRGRQMVSVSQLNNAVDVTLTDKLTPLQWARVFRFFEFVIGDRFHGSIFPLKNHVPFMILELYHTYDKDLSKNRSLMRQLDLEDHVIHRRDFEDNLNVLFERIERVKAAWNPDSIEARLEPLRQKHREFTQRMAGVLKEGDK